jgi:hypothetical protein
MDAQDFRSIQEAYMEVVENQQLDELTPATPRNIQRLVTKREKDARKAEDRTGHNFTPEYKKYFRTLKLGKVRSKFDRPASRSVEPASTNEETDLYDIILSHLLDEGYAETQEAAEAIMVNMSEDWREDIMEGMTMKDFKANRRKLQRKEASDDAKKRGHVDRLTGKPYGTEEAASRRKDIHKPEKAPEREARRRFAENPD